MPIEPTRDGHYVVTDAAGNFIDRHNYQEEAYGTVSRQPPGDYWIQPPRTKVTRTMDVSEPAPPEEDPPTEPEPEPPVDPQPPSPPSGDNPFNALYPAGFKLRAMTAGQIPTVTRPARSTGLTDFVLDAATGVHVHRVCDAAKEGSKDQLRPDYSRRQAFNCENTCFLLIDGNGQSYAYDAITLQKIGEIPVADGNCDPCWHPTNPKLLRHTEYTGGRRWYELDVESGVRKVLFDFAEVTPWPDATRYWTKAEGSFSADGRYICLMAMTDDYAYRGMVCLDAVEGRIVGSLSGSEAPDHVSMSACGEYCIYSGAQTIAYSRDFAQSRVLYDRSEHSDIGFGPNGESVIVHAIYSGDGDGRVGVTNIDTGDTFYLPHAALYRSPSSATAVHVCMQAFERPGWAVLSTYADYGPAADPAQWPMIRKVTLHELKPDGRAFDVAYTHYDASVGNAYFHEPQATISRDGSRILFGGSYSKPGPSAPGQPEAYMIGLPDSVYG